LKPLDQFESFMDRFRKKIPGGADADREPVEIRRDILREIAGQIQPDGSGTYFFPYTSIAIAIQPRNEAEWPVFEGLFESIDREIAEELLRKGCSTRALAVKTEIVRDASSAQRGTTYSIAYSRSAVTAAVSRPPARLRVLKGKCDMRELAIRSDRINIGRLREVTSQDGGALKRRNDLAFDESETTVGRYQASIGFDKSSGKFRLYDGPNSQFKTRIMREGRLIDCDSTRGVQLRPGDELSMGEALVSFELTADDSETRLLPPAIR
jgi:hypothetical protein